MAVDLLSDNSANDWWKQNVPTGGIAGYNPPTQTSYATQGLNPSTPAQPPAPTVTPNYGTPEEQQAARAALQSHVARQPFLAGKVGEADYSKAYDLYGQNRGQGQNYGDAVNHAISALGWDDPSKWTSSVTPTDAAAPPPTTAGTGAPPPAKTGSGNPESDFWNIYGNIAPSAKNLEQYFPQFQSMYPGAQLKKNASGYADAIILPNGQIIDTQRNSGYEHSDAWQWMPVGGNGSGGTGADAFIGAGNPVSGQFSDPATQTFAKLLEQQMVMLQQQQQAQLAQNDQLRQRQEQAGASSQDLIKYLQQRAGELQQPGYTPSEQNILKTQVTDPIEADRQAALKRALDNIGSRGFDPTSGIAQDLLRQVNQSFDQQRNVSQNALGVQQINEARSRQQEAQRLLAAIPQAQMAAATGDLSFLQQLNAAVNQLGSQALAPAGQLYELPLNAAQLGMSALGQAPSPQSLTAQTIQLAQLAQSQNANNANFWLQLGTSFAPFLQ